MALFNCKNLADIGDIMGKFRVFNTIKKVFVIDEFNKVFVILQSGKLAIVEGEQINYCGPEFIKVNSAGLKDKTGREIFNGDILKLKYHQNGITVEYYNGHYTCAIYDLRDCNETSEIIGSKYTNPELLNE